MWEAGGVLHFARVDSRGQSALTPVCFQGLGSVQRGLKRKAQPVKECSLASSRGLVRRGERARPKGLQQPDALLVALKFCTSVQDFLERLVREEAEPSR